MDVNKEQWSIIEHLFVEEPRQGPGRRPVDPRSALCGIFWVLETGKSWNTLPAKYPSRKACRTRHLKWRHSGLLREALLLLDEDLWYRKGIRANDLTLEQPDLKDRASWWWQTVLLLRSPGAVALLREEHTMTQNRANFAQPTSWQPSTTATAPVD